jgi:hypothetical protein
MGKSWNGPDFIDVMNVMRAIEEANGVNVSITLTLTMGSASGPMVVKYVATSAIHRVDGRTQVSLTRSWPNASGIDVASSLLGGLYALDVLCLQELWTQEQLAQM